MRAVTRPLAAALLFLFVQTGGFGDEVLFEDNFARALSPKWEVVGLKETDYRVKNGGLELRVQPGKLTADTPMLRVLLPFTSSDSVTASVRLTVLDEFTQDGELAGAFLIDETGWEFRATQERVGGKRVYSPGEYKFSGKPGEEGDPGKYEVAYTAATEDAGPLRIIVHRGHAFFQVGPSKERKYLNFFHSAIRSKTKSRGFCLTAAGAPEGAAHWVRFENFRVVK
jgi:hypothetical protein